MLDRSGNSDDSDEEIKTGTPIVAPFNPALGLSGGEDSTLFGALAEGGARFVACDSAVVFELVPSSRTTLRYLLKRSFGGGHGYARVRFSREGKRALPSLLTVGAAGLMGGAMLALLHLPFSFHRSVRYGRLAAAGMGKLVGLTRYEFRR